jgi:hypothetical protein
VVALGVKELKEDVTEYEINTKDKFGVRDI